MKSLGLLCATALLGAAFAAHAQDYHLNIGALSQSQGTPLFFRNSDTVGTNSALAVPLAFADAGTHAGFYAGGALTFAAIGTGFFDPPAPGTQVRVRFIAVNGPEGGKFGVWDSDGVNSASTVTFEVPTGTSNGTNSILVSENSGEPNADPFGHIHGRIYSATKPGLYVVTVQAYDDSANGAGGGPIHSPSELLSIYFQAGDTIASIERSAGTMALRFGTRLDRTYFVESSSSLSNPGAWDPVAGPLPGNDHLQTAADADITASQRFYRLRITSP